MGKANIPLIAFNRGLIDKTALARVDLDRTRLSAEIMTNWLPKTQGEMKLRPGTKYLGSSVNDTGAAFLEFVASTDDASLLEISRGKMRVWRNDALISSDSGVGTDFTYDTGDAASDDTGGWTDASIGGGSKGAMNVDQIPTMTKAQTAGVTMSASSIFSNRAAWKAGDDDNDSFWGAGDVAPEYLTVDFGSAKAVKTIAITAPPAEANRSPRVFVLQSNSTNDIADTGTWTNQINAGRDGETTIGQQTGWAVGETRTFTDTGYNSGTKTARYWRVYIDSVQAGNEPRISEISLYDDSAGDTGQVLVTSPTSLTLNAGSIGAVARARKSVPVSDTGEEHSLFLNVSKGPVTIRVGSTEGDDDYINHSDLGTGEHNLKFTPTGTYFWLDLQTKENVDRVVSEIRMGDTGTLELNVPWGDTGGHDLDNIRYDQSADIVFVDCDGYHPYQIERRGTGRSWSVVKSDFRKGPFLSTKRSDAKLTPSAAFGNISISSDLPFFRTGHIDSLIRVSHEGQSGVWQLGDSGATTDAIEVTGISDTGASEDSTPTAQSERRITFNVSGEYKGEITVERSFDGPDYGFKQITTQFEQSASVASDTGTFNRVFVDEDDNIKVWYRAKLTQYTSGSAVVKSRYLGGITDGIARITGYTDNQNVDAEVLSRFADTGTPEASDDWAEHSWSGINGYPTSVALHEGRLVHAGGANVYASVSDDYNNFDDTLEGDAAAINRTFGAGPVDNIYYLVSLLRLVAGTAGSEIAVKSSSLDEPLTPSNTTAKAFSTQGSANLRAVKMDQRAVFVQRSGQRVYQIGFGSGAETNYDYESRELTLLVPTLLEQGVKSVAIQRQPDTRVHFVLNDGTVAILTYEPQEEVLAWSKWKGDTGTGAFVERAAVLPGQNEDGVYYHVKRTINGATKRYLEKWAMETETRGDTGLTWLMDSAVSNTDPGKPTSVPGFSHLQGESIVAVANDTGQGNSYMKDLSRDTGSSLTQVTHYVNKASDTGDTGKISVDTGLKHVVGGLPYVADYRSSKLAYAAEAGTALTQMKRVGRLGLIMHKTHNRALYFGHDTGDLDPLPLVIDEGAEVDRDKIFEEFDQFSFSFNGLWSEDSRIYLRGKSPRPATIMAAVPKVDTHEK